MPRTRTIAEIRTELAAKEKQLAKLKARRSGLAKQLEGVDRQIAVVSGGGRRAPRKVAAGTAARGRKLPKNVKPLTGYIRDVLAEAKGGMRVKDIMVAVQKAGYKTRSGDFYGLVATAVRDSFRKVSRGVYALAASKKPAKKKAKKRAKRAKKAKGAAK